MYLTKIRLENTGPIDFINLELNTQGQNAPKPLVLVGRNGAGKSVLLSHVVSAMISAQTTIFDDGDVEKGRVYKLRSPRYIRRGEAYSLSRLEFSGGLFETEICLRTSKSNFEANNETIPLYSSWPKFAATETNAQDSNFATSVANLNDALKGPHLFFPPNRFEEPAWLNEGNLKNKVEYFDAKRIQGFSNRSVIQYAPMKENQSWLLDLIYDSHAIEKNLTPVAGTVPPAFNLSHEGPATTLIVKVAEFLKLLFGFEGQIRWSVGGRSRRSISVSTQAGAVVDNLFALSTGQSLMLDLFLTILRHADLAGTEINALSDVKGLVVIDEIDAHLHTSLQFDLLPKLIGLFPGVQFIVSTHSPMFLLGMEKHLGEANLTILELPTGVEISAERFCEFETAFKYLAETQAFETEISQKISEATQPLLITEGTTDIQYIRKAAELLGKADLLDGVTVLDGDGDGGLDKIWKNFRTERWTNANQKVVLLYDCDVGEKNNEIGNAYQRTIPIQDSIQRRGIENLFSTETLIKAREHKLAFIDHFPERRSTMRGEEKVEPEVWKINSNEKKNLCDWLCENGTDEDFRRFEIIFDIIENCFANPG